MRPAIRHLLEKLAARDDGFFVLRGGIVMAHFIRPAPRPIDDLDLLATVSTFEAELLRQKFHELVAAEGESSAVEILSEETIWAETRWPGLRFQLRFAGQESLQVDIGFGDPLVDGPMDLEILPGVMVSSCRPETLFAWKVHGLFENGPGYWRAKDLYDLLQMQRHSTLDRDRLAEAIALAFESRDGSFALASRFLAGEFGQSRGSRRKWRQFVQRRELVESEEELTTILKQVRAFIGPFLV